MDYTKATDEQLWTIMREDINCPLALMEGAVKEAFERDLFRTLIKSIVIKRDIGPSILQKLRLDFEDLVQIGYEAAFKAIAKYNPAKSTFTAFLYMKVFQSFGNVIKAANYQKRNSLDVSYQDLVLNEKSNTQTETFEDFLTDRKKNVEKTVIEKLLIEEGLSYCKPVQKETFILYFVGYTPKEISKMMGAPKGTVNRRLQEALTKIAGKPVNLRNIGYKFKRKGA